MSTKEPVSEFPVSTIHRDSAVPLYAQIQRDIEIRIATNQLCPDDSLPAETELAQQYGVSRVTVSKALRDLVTEGMLYRIQGKGTYISRPVIQRTKPNITSFFYEMVESGRTPTAKVWSKVCEPNPEAAHLLQIEPDELVIVTHRIRYVDDEPIIYQVNTTRHALCPTLADEDLSRQSFQYTLEVKYNLRYSEVEEKLSSVMPTEEVANHLGISRYVPILVDDRILHGRGGIIVGIMRAHLRGDRYTFRVARLLTASDLW